MKKTFPLHVPGKDDPRVIESVKNDVRKYVKRERRKKLPEGVDFWDFSCKVGADAGTAETKHLAEVTSAIDQIALSEAAEVYVELISIPGHRMKKVAAGALDEPSPEHSSDEDPSASDSDLLDDVKEEKAGNDT